MEKERLYNIIRYSMAVAAVALLLCPAVMRTEAGPSGQDVWSFRAVAAVCALAVPAGVAAACANRFRLRLHGLDVLVAGWWAWFALNYWLVSSFPAGDSFRTGTALFVAYVALRVMVPLAGDAFRRVWTVGLLAAGGYEAWVGWRQLAGWEVSHHHLFHLTGTFFNPGPYAVFVGAVMAVAWVAGCRKGNGMMKAGGCLCLPLLAASWSRAAWVAVAVAVVVWLWRTGRRRMVAWGTLVVLTAGVAAYFLKQGSADGRVLMAAVAGRAWLSEWWAGHGVGGYAHAYGEAQAEFFATRPDAPWAAVAGSPEYAFNALLGVGVEQGLAGAALALAVCLWSLGILLRRNDASAYGWLVLLVAAMFSYPFELWPFQMLAVGWVALAASRSYSRATEGGHWRDRAVALCLSCGMAGTAWLMWGFSGWMERRVEAYEEYRRVSGILDVDFLDEYQEMYEEMKGNPDYLFTFGSALRKAGRYNDSNAALCQGTRVSCDPMFYVVMGHNYHDLGAAREAEAAYRKAIRMVPGRLYPCYRLMKFYEAEGRTTEAADMARHIVETVPKVDSPAVRDMKEEARKILETEKKRP